MRPIVACMIVALVGCSASAKNEKQWPKPSEEGALIADRAEETPTPQRESGDVSGRYVGVYECPQGKTSLVLSLDQLADGRIEALFEFGPHQENPDVPVGSFRMRGVVNETGVLRLGATEDDWIEQPEGYMTVDLNGQFENENLYGEVVNPECTTFTVWREP